MDSIKKKIDIVSVSRYSICYRANAWDVHKVMKIKELRSISILGMGLLGGSLGLSIARTLPRVKRYGFSHREVTRQRALEVGAIDICRPTIAEAVADAQLVVMASPIYTFESLLEEMADHLQPGCIVTDVGSTKVLPVRWARKHLPSHVEFLGSHPMAGSEQQGVDFAMADLFEGAQCILTPTAKSQDSTIEFLEDFWETMGMRMWQMTPARHDKLVGRISHLPHVLAMSLVNMSDPDELLLCGKGFLDTTRIASGPPSVWRDILMGNAGNTEKAIGKLVKELQAVQKVLQDENETKIVNMLSRAQIKRNELIERKMQRKELPE